MPATHAPRVPYAPSRLPVARALRRALVLALLLASALLLACP